MAAVTIERMKVLSSGNLKAFVDLNFNGVVVKGFKIMDGANGLWLSMPSTPRKNEPGKWDDTVFIKGKELKEDIQEIVLAQYQAGITNQGGT